MCLKNKVYDYIRWIKYMKKKKEQKKQKQDLFLRIYETQLKAWQIVKEDRAKGNLDPITYNK